MWEICQTSQWLQNFITEQSALHNLTRLANLGGLSGVIGSLTGFGMACTFGEQCVLIPAWPVTDTRNVTKVQATMVLWSLNFLNNWFKQSSVSLDMIQPFFQDHALDVLDQLTPDSSIIEENVSTIEVINLISTVFATLPNPYNDQPGQAPKLLHLLFPPPVPDPDKPTISLSQLQATFNSDDGTIYATARNILAKRWKTLFNMGTDANAPDGILAVLANGAWFDFNRDASFASPATLQQVSLLMYEWLVSQSLQLNKVFLHAVPVDGGTIGKSHDMPGERFVAFENYTFDVWCVMIS